MTPPGSPAGRAAPLPPKERRAAIVAAATPLVCQHGTAVTTRQIARAAGIAEGTIFRAFPDKDSVLAAVVADVLDPTPLARELLALAARADPDADADPDSGAHADAGTDSDTGTDAPLEQILTAAVDLLRDRLGRARRIILMTQVRPPTEPGTARPTGGPHCRPDPAPVTDALARLLRPHTQRLRWDTDQVARVIRLVTTATTAGLDGTDPLPTAAVVDLLLHGITGRPGAAHPTGSPDPAARPVTDDFPTAATRPAIGDASC